MLLFEKNFEECYKFHSKFTGFFMSDLRMIDLLMNILIPLDFFFCKHTTLWVEEIGLQAFYCVSILKWVNLCPSKKVCLNKIQEIVWWFKEKHDFSLSFLKICNSMIIAKKCSSEWKIASVIYMVHKDYLFDFYLQVTSHYGIRWK